MDQNKVSHIARDIDDNCIRKAIYGLLDIIKGLEARIKKLEDETAFVEGEKVEGAVEEVKNEMRIKCAAIRYNGEIYEGESHCKIGLKMVRDGTCKAPYPGGDDQGFVTECGIYVRRAAAMSIARSAAQVEKGKTVHPRKLFSEDLRKVKK